MWGGSPFFIFLSLLPLALLRESSFSRGMPLSQLLLACFPLPSTCWTKLNPAVNTVGKENDFNLCKSVIKRWVGDFSCFQRNAGLIYDFIKESLPVSRFLASSQHLSRSLCATRHHHPKQLCIMWPRCYQWHSWLGWACRPGYPWVSTATGKGKKPSTKSLP